MSSIYRDAEVPGFCPGQKYRLYSDECSFNLFYNNGRERVSGTSGERYLPLCLTPVQRSNWVSVMVWVCVGYGPGTGVRRPNRRVPSGQEKVRKKWKSYSQEKLVNFGIGLENFKFVKMSEKSQENVVDVSMKDSFQIWTVNVMMWLLSVAVADNKCKNMGKRIFKVFGHFVD